MMTKFRLWLLMKLGINPLINRPDAFLMLLLKRYDNKDMLEAGADITSIMVRKIGKRKWGKVVAVLKMRADHFGKGLSIGL